MLFGIMLTIIIYYLSLLAYKRWKYAFLNPVFISTIAIVFTLIIIKHSYTEYFIGGEIIAKVLGPIIVMLAIPLYKNQKQLRENFLVIIAGIVIGMLTSFITVYLFSLVFHFPQELFLSLIPKSITTPLAVEVSGMLGGNNSLVIVFVILTGIIGNTIAVYVMKMAQIKSDLAKGIGIGVSSHGIGTAKAVEMNQTIGAMSGLAMSITGLLTVLVVSIVAIFL